MDDIEAAEEQKGDFDGGNYDEESMNTPLLGDRQGKSIFAFLRTYEFSSPICSSTLINSFLLRKLHIRCSSDNENSSLGRGNLFSLASPKSLKDKLKQRLDGNRIFNKPSPTSQIVRRLINNGFYTFASIYCIMGIYNFLHLYFVIINQSKESSKVDDDDDDDTKGAVDMVSHHLMH